MTGVAAEQGSLWWAQVDRIVSERPRARALSG